MKFSLDLLADFGGLAAFFLLLDLSLPETEVLVVGALLPSQPVN